MKGGRKAKILKRHLSIQIHNSSAQLVLDIHTYTWLYQWPDDGRDSCFYSCLDDDVPTSGNEREGNGSIALHGWVHLVENNDDIGNEIAKTKKKYETSENQT